MVIPDLGKGMMQAINLGISALQHVLGLPTLPRPDCTGDRWRRRRTEGLVQKAARAMKPFGRRERDDAPTLLPALTPRRDESPAGQPVMPASLRERVIAQIDPSVAATVSRDVLRRQIEEIIHGIANQERLELSGREQYQLADEIADDMTGYGPLRPLLLDDSISDIMVNAPSNVYVERKGKLERVAIRFPRQRSHCVGGAEDRRESSDAASTNPVLWWIAACRTAAGSTSSSRRWRSTVPAFPSANSQVAGMISPE